MTPTVAGHHALIEELRAGRWAAALDGRSLGTEFADEDDARAAVIAAMRDWYGFIPQPHEVNL